MEWMQHIIWILFISICNCLEEESDRSWPKSSASYKIMNRQRPQINKRGAEGKNTFHFPGLSSRSGDEFNLVIPDECKNLGICEDIPNYPEDLVNQIIQEVEQSNLTRFNKDVLPPPQIAERIGPEQENLDLCTSRERLFAPRAAQDINKDWQVIINGKQKPVQTYRVEICKGPVDSPCSQVAYFQSGYEAHCVQKFQLRQMYTINEKNEIEERPFHVPSCCSCVVRTV